MSLLLGRGDELLRSLGIDHLPRVRKIERERGEALTPIGVVVMAIGAPRVRGLLAALDPRARQLGIIIVDEDASRLARRRGLAFGVSTGGFGLAPSRTWPSASNRVRGFW